MPDPLNGISRGGGLSSLSGCLSCRVMKKAIGSGMAGINRSYRERRRVRSHNCDTLSCQKACQAIRFFPTSAKNPNCRGIAAVDFVNTDSEKKI